MDVVGFVVVFDVESEVGEVVLGEEDGGGLECLVDVVVVVVDYEDEVMWWRGGGEL